MAGTPLVGVSQQGADVSFQETGKLAEHAKRGGFAGLDARDPALADLGMMGEDELGVAERTAPAGDIAGENGRHRFPQLKALKPLVLMDGHRYPFAVSKRIGSS
jgi:hypothetical protein